MVEMDCDCTALGALPLILTKRISVWGRDGDGEPREGGALREKGEIEAGEISEGPQAKGGGGWGEGDQWRSGAGRETRTDSYDQVFVQGERARACECP